MKKKYLFFLIAIIALALILFMAGAFEKNKTFHGRVIDAETKEPIEGAVVVAHWVEARATVAGESTRYKDVKEVLTNKNGEWSITGPQGSEGSDSIAYLTFFTGIHYTRKPDFIIFKPGFCSYPEGLSIGVCKGIKFSGTGEIFGGKTLELPKLPKVMNREETLMAIPGPVVGKDAVEKQKEFIRMINEGKKNLGFPEVKY